MSDTSYQAFRALDWSSVRGVKVQGSTIKVVLDNFGERQFTFDSEKTAAAAFLEWARKDATRERS